MRGLRFQLLACLALFLWTAAGVLASAHCACADADHACEHAGRDCSAPGDCSDCFQSHDGAVADVPALPAPILLKSTALPALVPVADLAPAALLLRAVGSPCQKLVVVRTRPPALRPGAFSLRL